MALGPTPSGDGEGEDAVNCTAIMRPAVGAHLRELARARRLLSFQAAEVLQATMVASGSDRLSMLTTGVGVACGEDAARGCSVAARRVRMRAPRVFRAGGAARVALVIPPEYQRNIRGGHTGVAQMIIDAADPQSSGAAIAGAQLAAQARGAQLLATQYKIRPPVEIRVRPWYNPAQKSATFIVPGIVGILLTITMTLMTLMAMSIMVWHRARSHMKHRGW
jgi:hypothetical protein